MNIKLAFVLAMSLIGPPTAVAGTDLPASIGVATMSSDGTIRLQLMARSDEGAIGDAMLVYRVGDPQYDDILRHIGGIKPGEEKPVPPWPDPAASQQTRSSP